MKRNNYFLVINLYVDSISRSVRSLVDKGLVENPVVVVLTCQAEKYQDLEMDDIELIILPVDFDDSDKLRELISPFVDSISAVICRGDGHIQYLRKIIPHLPDYCKLPSLEALETSTNKKLMRQKFLEDFPEISPKFVEVLNANKESIASVEAIMDYPVIVKPASLVSSMLIQSCENREELVVALNVVFGMIHSVYEREHRTDTPHVIVEEFLNGDFYSIDAYRLDDDFYFCPPVGYLPAKSMGIDDFYLYKRWLPTSLTKEELSTANETCIKAMRATGLTYSVAHIELIKTSSGWKVIELGPRLGRFRRIMYQIGYGIDHSTNDILVRMNQPIKMKNKLRQFCCAYSIYPSREGKLRSIKGIEILEAMTEVSYLKRISADGEMCKFAKNGGKALLEIIVNSANESRYQDVCRLIEEQIKAEIVD